MIAFFHRLAAVPPRLGGFGIAFLLIALFGTAAGEAGAEETIQRFATDVSVSREGALRVVETIRVNAEGRQISHGIYRDFPLTFEDSSGAVHRVGFDLVSVTRDGQPEPHFTENHGETIRIYAGDRNSLVAPGVHTYVFTYDTDRQIRWFGEGAELYWNVTGNAWAFPIESAVVRVSLPGGASPSQWTAYTGAYGERGTDWRGAVTDGVLAVETTRSLDPHEGFTIVAAIPSGVVTPPTRADETRYFLRDHRGSIIGVVGFAVLLGYYWLAWNAVGRDPKPGTIIPLFHPPKDVSPALASYIYRWGLGGNMWRAFTAAALNLAVRGLLVFDQGKKGELTLERTSAAPPGNTGPLPPGEQAIFRWVELEGGRGEINQANAVSVQAVTRAFRKSIVAENRDKFFHRNTAYFVGGVGLTVLVLLAILVFGGLGENDIGTLMPTVFIGLVFGIFIVPTLRTLFGAPSFGASVKAAMTLIVFMGFFGVFAAQFISGMGAGANTALAAIARHPFAVGLALMFPAVNGLFFYLLRAPTALGRPVMDQIAGLRMYLETAESGRLNMAGAPEITTERFEALLPYAVALEVEKPWAGAFAAALARAHPNDPDPMGSYRPGWNRGAVWSGADFGRSVASTVSAATGALAASMPRSSSGSSGFSGGGGSGGGGGGGGGGGW